MKLKVILRPNGAPDPRGIRHQLLQRYQIDYTELLQLALLSWEALETGDDESLLVAMEAYLNRRGRRAPQQYSDLIEGAHYLRSGLHQIHSTIGHVLTPIADRYCHGYDYDLRLAQHIGMDAAAVIEVTPRY